MVCTQNKESSVYFHADDIGLSAGITDTILDAIDNGSISSVSLIVNSDDSERAANELLRRPHVKVSLHLNLVEGKFLNPARSNKIINSSFNEIFIKSIFNVNQEQIFSEIEEQIKEFQKIYISKLPSAGGIRVDGHMHIHCIPSVNAILISLAPEYNITSIRVPNEKLFFKFEIIFFTKYILVNYLKNILLKFLCTLNQKSLQRMNLNDGRKFIGILFTGQMTAQAIEYALSALNPSSETKVEILLHPGSGAECEEIDWKWGRSSWEYCSSSWREKERLLAKSPILNKFKGH